MKILIITLSNIGDAVLTTGVLEALKAKFPNLVLDIVVDERAQGVFSCDDRVNRIHLYKKSLSFLDKFRFFISLRKQNYDLVVDLKNIFASFLISFHSLKSKKVKAHAYLKHNMALRELFSKEELGIFKPKVLWSDKEREHIDSFGLNKYLVISATAKSFTKSWPLKHYKALIALLLMKYPDLDIVLTGNDQEKSVLEELVLDGRVKNLGAKTTIPQLACLIAGAEIVITNDSASLHLSSSSNRPTVAIFGPTPAVKYGPLADNSALIKRSYSCSPCEKAQCIFSDKRCLESIKPYYVLNIIEKILDGKKRDGSNEYNRILLSRTDRMGDLLLTTPAIEAVRNKFPNAYICFLSNSKTVALLKDNPYIDEVIGLDKDKNHKGILGFLRLLREIRERKFDLSVHLHPTNRNHLLSFLGSIPKRVGYDSKLGLLNNMRVEHKKQEGEKSEAEYNFDLLRKIGIDKISLNQFIVPDRGALEWVDRELQSKNITRFAVIHPGASCKSKLWDLENFIELSKRIKLKNNLEVIFILGPDDEELRDRLNQHPEISPYLYYNITLERSVALISRASLMISNDSGPMHIADSLDKPLIVIFGRNQAGLSYKRWGPLGEHAKVIYEDSGCKECLAHNCKKGFICLKNIAVDRVYGQFVKMISEVQI
ncbi:MAG: glycosyltransferase family 9 protein [Candidatus Kaelpia aquatica]|nr:glycosyltransferase family 9 protein [Candidatus Kaelpia aquatica]